ncbi:fatty acid--CoA ligase family protein [Actinocorallia sp. B10E7]|uniref:class I adenylate-forming enzyme family protein n=1 Tax=Actinocorallia sp. B10E7 TaxID=3153558 RepID=UPI00325EB57A
MNTLMLLEMTAAGFGERVALGPLDRGMTYEALQAAALSGGARLRAGGRRTVVYIGENGPAFPVALFAAAAANVPFLPLNYRLTPEQVADVAARQDRPLVIAGAHLDVLAARCEEVLTPDEWIAQCTGPGASPADQAAPAAPDTDDIAVLLQTSGTTSAPKSAVLRHRHLTAYTFGTVEFGSADEHDATLVSVPPYHIAAVANLLTNLYAGRRIVYLEQFTATGWLDLVRTERITHAMVVPTMLARIVDELERTGEAAPPSLRAVSYGGSKMPRQVVERALRAFPETDFTNAYGLTETSSSIAVLGPQEHRAALAATEPGERARLGSAGLPLPDVAVEIRDDKGLPCPAGVTGDIWVRGPQVAGEYLESGTTLDGGGWFSTRDRGHLDEDGYLFVEGRSDDTIIRGGENIAPAEIESVLLDHPAVAEVAVAGVEDVEWGQRIAAFVVRRPGPPVDAADVQAWVRARLRGSKTPDLVMFLDELPQTDTGKVLRRVLVERARAASA